jgi:DNA-binding transcriptional ArsR family regulator
MSLEASVNKFTLELERAIDQSEWERVDICRERLKTLLLDAVRIGIRPVIARIDAALSRARGKLVFGREVELTSGPNGAAWMLAADIETARLAGRQLPSSTAQPVDNSAKDKVIAALKSADHSGFNNSQLSDRTGLPAETVARVLKVLREGGLVAFRKVGRFTINRLITHPRGPAAEAENPDLRVTDPALHLMVICTNGPLPSNIGTPTFTSNRWLARRQQSYS